MKRIYASLALLLIVVTGAFAQRHCDIAIIGYYGPADSTTFNCSNPVLSGYIYVNNGPDTLLATDTFYFRDPNIDSGYIYKDVPLGAVLTGGDGDAVDVNPRDTVINFQWTDSLVRILQLRSIDSPYNLVYAPTDGSGYIANGYYYYPIEFLGFQDTTQVVDNYDTNDYVYPVVKVDCNPLSINDVKYNRVNLTIYPNPASNSIYFNYTFTKPSAITARIMDLSGRTLNTINLGKAMPGSQKYQIDVSSLPQGTYLLEFATDDTKGISKFTKD